ncbi:MAG: LTA synthase family protein [Bacillota bacterium]|nr:LTA synthase family protein [Bacillota bacterium]
MKTLNRIANKLKAKRWVHISALIGAVLFPVFLVIMVELIHFNSLSLLFKFINENTLIFLFDILLISIIYIVGLLILRRIWQAASITGIALYILAMVDYNKYETLRQYLFPWDLYLMKNADSFTTISAVYFSFYSILMLILLLSYLFILLVANMRINLTLIRRFAVSAAMVFAIVISFKSGYISTKALPAMGMTSVKNPSDNYQKNGLIASFSMSVNKNSLTAPDGYSSSSIEEGLSSYPPVESSNFEKPDVIVILSEALFDVTQLPNTKFSVDPLKNIHNINNQSIRGTMISPTFGGGTVRPEFEMLTGLTVNELPSGTVPYQQYVKNPVWSYAWHYKDLGYSTVAVHTYNKTFFDRERCYPLLGFDKFIGMQDLEDFGITPVYKNKLISDDTFANTVIKALDEAKQPTFLFGITMQNHTPYLDKYDSHSVTVSNSSFSDEEINILENYCEGTKDNDAAFQKIIDYINTRNKPTILVYFGDHLPALGTNNSIYVKSGLVKSDQPTEWSLSENNKMYGTPLIIYSNYNTGKKLTIPDSGISPYNVLALVSQYIGAPQDNYMSFLVKLANTMPVKNPVYYVTNGNDAQTISKMDALHEMITYDRLLGKGYSQPSLSNK